MNSKPQPTQPPRLIARARTSPHPDTPAPHRRTGKIARLPTELRELINAMLLEGLPYAEIIQRLSHSPNPPPPDAISIHNLSRWKAGGHQDWLREQSWLEEMRLRLDFADKIVQQKNGAMIDAASLRIAVTRMYTLLMQFDPSVLSKQLAREPSTYPRILNALCKLTETAVHLERNRQDHATNTFRSRLQSANPCLPPTAPPAGSVKSGSSR